MLVYLVMEDASDEYEGYDVVRAFAHEEDAQHYCDELMESCVQPFEHYWFLEEGQTIARYHVEQLEVH